jgi:hypothetical protein
LRQGSAGIVPGLELRQVPEQVDKMQFAAVAGKEIDGLRQGTTDMQYGQAAPFVNVLEQGWQQR